MITLCLGKDSEDGDWVVEIRDGGGEIAAEVHAPEHDRALELAQLEIVRLACDE